MNKIEELRCDIYIICEIGGVLEDVILYCRGERYDYNTSGRSLDIDRRIEKTLNIVGEEVWSEIDMGCCIVGIDYPIRRI